MGVDKFQTNLSPYLIDAFENNDSVTSYVYSSMKSTGEEPCSSPVSSNPFCVSLVVRADSKIFHLDATGRSAELEGKL